MENIAYLNVSFVARCNLIKHPSVLITTAQNNVTQVFQEVLISKLRRDGLYSYD